jgi:hypothetical protein
MIPLIPNPAGNYHFLAGIEPYSCGVRADAGFEVVHVTLARLVPWREGFDRIIELLHAAGRTRAALCAIELRSPAPFTREGFIEFNQGYCRLLEDWGLLVDGRNPVARTNVAPAWNPPPEPSLHAFTYTAPVSPELPPSFIVAGAGELAGSLREGPVVRAGERSTDAMREKAEYVMSVMTRRLNSMALGWEQVSATDVYTAEPMDGAMEAAVLNGMGPATRHGVCHYYARPPIDELFFEMDCRGVRTELCL